MSNQVTLTFAGDTKNAESAFDRVGSSASTMGRRVEESGHGFDRAGESADAAESKAQGFSDTLTGVADIGAGTSEIMKGNLFEGFVTVGQGAADLAGGMADFLIPALQKSRIATLAKAAADKAAAAGSKVWTAAQWLMNTALLASPLTWILLAIAAVVVIIVLIAKKTDWFSKAWGAAWAWIKRAASNTWDFLKKIPGWIGSAFSKVAGFITAPYRAAFNAIARLWNSTIGQLSWTAPDWLPFIGGKTISVPHLPTFHAGGVVPGVVGQQVPIMAMGGERVSGFNGRGGDDRDDWIRIDAGAIGAVLLKLVSDEVRGKGGRVTHLGVQVVGGKVRT